MEKDRWLSTQAKVFFLVIMRRMKEVEVRESGGGNAGARCGNTRRGERKFSKEECGDTKVV